jgi:hypothetical protein
MKSKEELKFKNRQMGGAGFVANKIMENIISEFKQETLEEAAERIAYDSTEENKGFPSIKMFIKGGNWQAERMYSKEEVEQIARFGFNAGRRVELKAVDLDFTFEKWFEEFKKK